MRRTPPIFVGPVHQENQGDEASPWVFLFMQAGTDPIKLQYPTRSSAVTARKNTAQASGVFRVDNEDLFEAIRSVVPVSPAPSSEEE